MAIRSTVAALALALAGATSLATTASAAPLGLGQSDAGTRSAIEKIELVTKCWETPSGRRRCKTFYVNAYKYNNPNRYPVGSTEWWRAMDRNGSGGYRR
jgi:hypothetical protein